MSKKHKFGMRPDPLAAGKYETIGGVACYVATPKGDYAKDKVVLFLPDVFGIPLVNNRVRNRAFCAFIVGLFLPNG